MFGKKIKLLKDEIELLKEMLVHAYYDNKEIKEYDLESWLCYLRKVASHSRFLAENERQYALLNKTKR